MAEKAADPEAPKGAPPRIKIARAAKHLPPARLGSPYVAKLDCDVEDAVFVAGAVCPGLAIAKDGTISGTLTDIGPYRFEVTAVSKTRGAGYGTFAVSASRPAGPAAHAPAAPGITPEQVAAMIREAVAEALAGKPADAQD